MRMRDLINVEPGTLVLNTNEVRVPRKFKSLWIGVTRQANGNYKRAKRWFLQNGGMFE